MKKKLSREEFQALPFHRKAFYLVRTRWGDVLLGAWLIFLMGTWIWQDVLQIQPDIRIEMFNGADAHLQQEPAARSRMAAPQPSCTMKISNDLQTDALGGVNPGAVLFCKVHEEKTDIYFWDSPLLEIGLIQHDLQDLREILPPELLEAYGDALIYTDLQLEGGYPCGIRLENNSWLHGNGYYDHGAAVGVSRNCSNPETAAQFLMEIL